VDTLAPREAFVLYARNAHRLDDGELYVRERALMQALRRIFGQAPVASRDCPWLRLRNHRRFGTIRTSTSSSGKAPRMKVLVTGSAGFIGSHVAHKLLARGDEVIGFDNLNDYYDVGLKRARLARLEGKPGFSQIVADLADRAAVEAAFAAHKPDRVVNLAAQAGVRYAAQNPHAYVDSNVTGFLHILEGCRHHGVQHLVYASTSSVYGANTAMPFSEHASTEHPLTIYAATKKANEMMAHSYAHLYGIPATGLRFFTVYGPWGRPDMALFLFTRAILAGEPIKVFNHGHHKRSFTYVDDIAEGVVRTLDRVPGKDPDWSGLAPDPATSGVAPYRLYNIGNEQPVELLRYIEVLEQCLGRKAVMEMLPLQAGDVPDTEADISDLVANVGYRPVVPVEEGVANFVRWYRDYYKA
jgi:UDP-glucuronate 4-epimerase